jgi:polyisoprenoid-binding protein YceI
MKNLILSLLVFAAAASVQAAVETYQLDPAHTSIGFSVRHVFTSVPGQFTKFSGTLTLDRDNLENSKADVTIESSSVDTRNAKRDTHLKSGDFLVVDKFPEIRFVSKSWKKTGDDTYDITGDLTIRGITREVTLHAKSLGFGPGLGGTTVTGWEGKTTLKRHDFDINLNAMLEKALGEDIDVTIGVEADLKK